MAEEVHPFQRMMDAMSESSRMTRSDYHLTLGAAIAWLGEVAPSTEIRFDNQSGVGAVKSYRGYYSDVAFEPLPDVTLVGAVLADLHSALGKTFEGYKGGDFLMGKDTPLWVSTYGDASGLAVVGAAVEEGIAVFKTRHLRD